MINEDTAELSSVASDVKLLEELKQLFKTKAHPMANIKANGRKRDFEAGIYPPYYHLKQFILRKTPLLDDPFYTLDTRTWWVLNGITSWEDPRVQCENCHRPLKDKNVISTHIGYHKFCSTSCASSSDVVQAKILNTYLEKYGSDWSKIKADKAKKTKLERYGNENYSNWDQMVKTKQQKAAVDPDFFKKIDEKSRATKLERYGDPNYNNTEQAVATRLEHNNGVYETAEIQEKKKQTCRAHFGVDWCLQSEVCKEKSKATCMKNYGVEWGLSSPIVRERSAQTCLKKYGVRHNAQSRDFRIKSSMRYTYNGLHFDSSPELALYIYLTDSKIPFEYQPDVNLMYEFEGKVSRYFPDFLIEGKLIELKGDQFIKEDGTWQCPWDHSKDAGYEAKHQCVVKNNVEIWTSKDYMQYVKYVKQKYGKGYLHQFKNKLKSETDEPELKPLAQDNIFV